MKELKPKELREKTVPELEEILKHERIAIHKARRDLVLRQITDTNVITARRHNIARIMTLISEKQRGKA